MTTDVTVAQQCFSKYLRVFADCVAFRVTDGGGMMKFASDLAVAKLPNTLLLFSFFLRQQSEIVLL